MQDKKLLKKMRLRFVAITMLISLIFLISITGMQYASSVSSAKREAESALDATLQKASPVIRQGQTGGRLRPGWQSSDPDNDLDDDPDIDFDPDDAPDIDDPFIDEGMGRLETICVKYDSSGKYTLLKNDIFFIDDDDIQPLSDEVLSSDETGKTAMSGDLMFRKEVLGDDTYIAFVSIERNLSLIRSQLYSNIIISIIIFILLLILSLILSRRVVRPVEKAWDDQRRFIADASHELKTPLSVIMSNAQMLTEKGGDMDKRQRQRADNIMAESIRMKELVNELIDVARGDAGMSGLKSEPFDISYIVNECIMAWEPAAFESGKSICSDTKDGLTAIGDKEKVRQIINIFIDNAIKYSDKGTEITVSLKPSGKGNELLLSVSDKGNHIDDEAMSHLFDRFYREDSSREQIPGYGLGLSIAKGIAENMGAGIWAESTEQGFNTFCLSLRAK